MVPKYRYLATHISIFSPMKPIQPSRCSELSQYSLYSLAAVANSAILETSPVRVGGSASHINPPHPEWGSESVYKTCLHFSCRFCRILQDLRVPREPPLPPTPPKRSP